MEFCEKHAAELGKDGTCPICTGKIKPLIRAQLNTPKPKPKPKKK